MKKTIGVILAGVITSLSLAAEVADAPPLRLKNWEAVQRKLGGVRKWALPYLVFPALDKTGVSVWRAPGGVPKGATMDDVPAFAKMTVKEFFPFIDKYGQFMHRDWPDKIHSDKDFAEKLAREEKDLAAHPGPKGWNKWGGWAEGPRLEARGHFYVTKHEGKWWYVDPDGCLWWSHGPVRVTPSSAVTPLDGRLDWFAELPVSYSSDPFAQFYQTRDEMLVPSYVKRNIRFTYDFSSANLRRKYGENWFDTYAKLAHRRLRSWGCNTIANSSNARICHMDKTPYAERFGVYSRAIEGAVEGLWWPFRDPFCPSFRAAVRRQLAHHKAELDDPWCVGFFVDNELNWGNPQMLGLGALKSPADQPCKIEFIKHLRSRYGTIESLNEAWKSAYASWDALLADRKGPDARAAGKDLAAFSEVIAHAYYANIRDRAREFPAQRWPVRDSA